MTSRIKSFIRETWRDYKFDERRNVKALASHDLIKKADQCLVQGAYSYGPNAFLERTPEYYEDRLKKSVAGFIETKNLAYLVDAVNWIRMLWNLDDQAYFEDISSDEGRDQK